MSSSGGLGQIAFDKQLHGGSCPRRDRLCLDLMPKGIQVLYFSRQADEIIFGCGGDVRRGDVVRRGVGAGGLVAGIGDEHGVHSGKAFGIERLGVDADLELSAQAGEDFLVVAVGLVARLAEGVEVTAVEEDGLRCLGCGERYRQGRSVRSRR